MKLLLSASERDLSSGGKKEPGFSFCCRGDEKLRISYCSIRWTPAVKKIKTKENVRTRPR
jgi:hypothetical protein